MKICVTGKGGSGKSLVSVLLAKVLAARGYNVLLVDADESNLGLQRMLGATTSPQPLMDYLGGKPALQKKMMDAMASRAAGKEASATILPEGGMALAGIPPENVALADGVRVVRIGKIEHSSEGCACPMGALAREFLAKLDLGPRDIVITDHEAGVEHFGRGVEKDIDAILVVVDPSYESVLMAEKIAGLAGEVGSRIVIALNRVTPDIKESLTDSLSQRGLSVDGSIAYDEEAFNSCLRGAPLGDHTQAASDVGRLISVLGL